MNRKKFIQKLLLLFSLLACLWMAAGCQKRQLSGEDLPPDLSGVSSTASGAMDGESMPGLSGGEAFLPASSGGSGGLDAIQKTDGGFDAVTSHIDFDLPKGLSILHPREDTRTSAGQYYLTGVSDPAQELLMNGTPVENRGASGSFALSVTLAEGDNVFTFRQESEEKQVHIQRSAAGAAAKVSTVSKMEPAEDLAVKSGEGILLYCVAPSGGKVTAEIAGERIPLAQNAATQEEGVAAGFSARYTPPATAGTVSLGNVTYTLSYQGEITSSLSQGRLFAAGTKSPLAVRIQNVSSSVFEEPSINSPVMTTAKAGAMDIVTDFGGDESSGPMYRLRMGGWVQAAAVTPRTGFAFPENILWASLFEKAADRETVILRGTAYPFYIAGQEEQTFEIRFFHTEKNIGELDLTKSDLFSGVQTKQDGEDLVLRFSLKTPDALWGYHVQYQNGATLLSFKSKPLSGPEDAPLKGITVAVDAGHGGTDVGSLGVPYDQSPMEKDITIATAQALEKYLTHLGARVVMVRRDDENPSMNERMQTAADAWADFYISLHTNSAGYTEELIGAKGLEVYYFEPASEELARLLAEGISEKTQRLNRGAKHANYRVTMNSFAPSILIEMGFMPNPGDFDSLCSKEGIYQTVQAIGDNLVSFLS